jgi:hypothetical protein
MTVSEELGLKKQMMVSVQRRILVLIVHYRIQNAPLDPIWTCLHPHILFLED